MSNRAILVLSILAIVLAAPALSASDYTLTSTDSRDIPEKTVSVEGEGYTVSSMVTVFPGDSITASITKPEDVDGRVYMYRNDDGVQTVQIDKRVYGSSDTVTFSTSNWEAGSYVMSLYANGSRREIMPVVLNGYQTAIEVPAANQVDQSMDVSVTLDEDEASLPPHSVEFVLANNSYHQRVDGEKLSGGEYEATISRTTYSLGEYYVYAAVYSDESMGEDSNEIIAVSDSRDVEIVDEKETTTTEDTSSKSSTTDEDGETTSDPPASTSTDSTTPEQTSPTTSSDQLTTTEGEQTTVQTSDPGQESSSTSTETGIIQPNTPTKTGGTTTETTAPASPLIAIVGISLVGFLVWNRRTKQ